MRYCLNEKGERIPIAIPLQLGAVVCQKILTNDNCRIYHLRRPLYDEGRTAVCHWERNAPKYLQEEDVPALFLLIGEKISGIYTLFSPETYEIWVSKSAAFDWEEIEPTLIEVLNLYNKGEKNAGTRFCKR